MKGARGRDRVWIRLFTLLAVACAMAFGAAAAMENEELEKILGSTIWREASLLIGPLAAIALINFNMQARTLGRKDLVLEALLVATAYCLFLTISLPIAVHSEQTCRVFGFFCEEGSRLMPAALFVVTCVFLAASASFLIRRVRHVYGSQKREY